MKRTNRPGLLNVSLGEMIATLKTLEDLDVTVNHLARLRAEPEYAKRVADFIVRGGLAGEIKYKNARAILGDNFFGPEEWLADYGFNLTQEQFEKITNFPWSEDVLNSPCPFIKGKPIKETHFAFLGFESIDGKSLTILRWNEMHPRPHLPRFYQDIRPSYRKEAFAKKETCYLRWYLMPLVTIQESLDKNYKDQLKIVPKNYEVATAIEEVTKNILYYRKTGICHNAEPLRFNQCQNVYYKAGSYEGSQVTVGWFEGTKLLEVSGCWHNSNYPSGGIALSMRS